MVAVGCGCLFVYCCLFTMVARVGSELIAIDVDDEKSLVLYRREKGIFWR